MPTYNAVISKFDAINIDPVTGDHVLTVEAQIENASNTSSRQIITVSAATFSPLLTNWRLLIRDQVIAQALANLGITVTSVMFQDYSIL